VPAHPEPNTNGRPEHLGDFTVTPRVLLVCALALPIGVISALGAWCLLRLIGLFTNVFFYGRFATPLVAPGSGHHSWLLVLLNPIGGGLVVGLMARYGSEKIRGHGMPEAIESILTGGSRVQPRVAVLKPISAAISIGSGGPFGAEGPIIMTGGALGSILAQFLRLTADERKTLLVAGAAGGMAATFNAPLASVLLAVELLLFEWRPRSMVPVAASVAIATAVRMPLLGAGPVFGVSGPAIHISALLLAGCVLAGLFTGLLGTILTGFVYAAEDAFNRLPIHWMWWPAIGGLIIGLGGLVEPRALGVGYDVIRELLRGQAATSLIVGILVVKSLIWSLSLGSGTSGGVLAPMFMIGAALGALGAHVLPAAPVGFWPLVCLAGVLGGVMRSPFTGVVFSLELTHRWGALLPLLVAASTAYLLTALVLKRSVLTEKVARRGFHLTREYDVDPLGVLFVREVMDAQDIVVYRASDSLRAVIVEFLGEGHRTRTPAQRQRLYPVTDRHGVLRGILTRRDVLDYAIDLENGERVPATVGEAMTRDFVAAHPDDTLRDVANGMAQSGTTRMPVVPRDGAPRLLGIITLPALLQGRLRDLQEERETERVLRVARLHRWRRSLVTRVSEAPERECADGGLTMRPEGKAGLAAGDGNPAGERDGEPAAADRVHPREAKDPAAELPARAVHPEREHHGPALGPEPGRERPSAP
jgi:H+/Cl- antiporter ClcA/CBS domain-containing protein